MRIISLLLWLCFFILQYHLWIGDFGIASFIKTHQLIKKQKTKNDMLAKKNQQLIQQVVYLQNNVDTAAEVYAREKLNMVEQDQLFYFTPQKNKNDHNLKSP